MRKANGLGVPSVLLTETGPLVALIDADDFQHVRAGQTLSTLPNTPLLTTWPCLTEAMYLLGKAAGYPAQEELWQFVQDGLVVLHAPSEEEWMRMRVLMAEYKDAPMDMADASLVGAAETLGAIQIFTFDGHFYAYRTAGGAMLHVVP